MSGGNLVNEADNAEASMQNEGGRSTPACAVGGISPAGAATALAPVEQTGPVFSSDEAGRLRARRDADVLVTGAMQRLSGIFAAEDLRLALQRYCSFFGRLLSI